MSLFMFWWSPRGISFDPLPHVFLRGRDFWVELSSFAAMHHCLITTSQMHKTLRFGEESLFLGTVLSPPAQMETIR